MWISLLISLVYRLQTDFLVRWCHMYKMSTTATCSAYFLSHHASRWPTYMSNQDQLQELFCSYPQEHPRTITNLREAIYYRTHLFLSKELCMARSIYSPMKQSLARLCFAKRFQPCIHKKDPCSVRHRFIPRSVSHSAQPIPSKEVDPLSFSYIRSSY